jgi:Flp pilus assembly protein TadB
VAERSSQVGPPARRRSPRWVGLVGALLALALAPAAAAAPAGDAATTPTAPAAGVAATTATTTTATTAATTTAVQTVTATQTATRTATLTATTTATRTQTSPAIHTAPPANISSRSDSATALSGWLSPVARFPHRAFVLSLPPGQVPTAAQLSLTENGAPVHAATMTPLTAPAAGDLGVMLVIGRSAAMAPALKGLFSAAGTLAAQRPSAEALGLLTFDAAPDTVLAPTTDAGKITAALGAVPTAGAGADVGAATEAAVHALTRADVALGVAVVVSDGVGLDAGAASAARAEAAAAHVPVVTIGLRDAQATRASLAALRSAAPGTFLTATPATLASRLESAVDGETSTHELLRWRSTAAAGTPVQVKAAADGVAGAATSTYTVPTPPPASTKAPAVPRRKAHPAARHRAHRSSGVLASTGALTPAPPTAAPAPTASGFWHSDIAVIVVALLVALLVGTAVMFILRRPDQRAARARVGSYIPTESDEADAGAFGSEEPSRKGLLGILQRGTWWPAFVEAVEVSRNPKTPGFLMKRAAIVAVLVAVVLVLVSHVVFLFVVPLIAFPFVERAWVMRAARKQREKFADSLPSYMQDMASAIRVGRSFAGALAVVADSADEPTRSEFDRAVTDESLGRPVEESLLAVGERMHSTDMEQIALIAELNRRSGSNVAESLDRVAEGARDRADLRREMRALTAQSKMSSSVLTGLPIVLLLGLSVLAPVYAHPLFHTVFGWVSLGFATILVFTGWKVLKKISDVGGV